MEPALLHLGAAPRHPRDGRPRPAALGGLGGVLEGRAWAKPLEATRLVATPLVLWMLVG
nr:hypothetical protein [Polyangium spumosum]